MGVPGRPAQGLPGLLLRLLLGRRLLTAGPRLRGLLLIDLRLLLRDGRRLRLSLALRVLRRLKLVEIDVLTGQRLRGQHAAFAGAVLLVELRQRVLGLGARGWKTGRPWRSLRSSGADLPPTGGYSEIVGSDIVTVVPRSDDCTAMRPPCCLTMRLTMARPRPVPLALVVKNGSNIRAWSSAETPGP